MQMLRRIKDGHRDALVENDEGLRFVNFTGSYRTETRGS